MTDIMRGQTFVGIVSLLGWGLGYCGQPHILVRFMAARSIKVIPNARRIGILWMIFCLAGAIGVGFFGAAYFAQHPESAGLVQENHERVFIVLSSVLFNPWIAGFLMSAILAAVMSTLSCQLLVCSSTLTQDFYRTFIRRNASQRELVWFGRFMVLAVSVVALWLASDPNSLVFSLVSYAWAGFGAAFGPVIVLSLWWPRMTRNGALAGMIVGAATVLIWNHFAWFGLYEIIPGFAFALIAIVVVSLLDKKPTRDMLRTFGEVDRIVRSDGDVKSAAAN
jgi:sodium/proline symporter